MRTQMIKALRNLTGRDKRALAIFAGIALLCSLYFASGILVTYVSSPFDEFEIARDGSGFTVRVLGLQTYAGAEQLRSALLEQRQLNSKIEAIPSNQGYVLKIGPFVRREAAEALTTELQNSGYNIVNIVENCSPGNDCDRGDQTAAGAQQTDQ